MIRDARIVVVTTDNDFYKIIYDKVSSVKIKPMIMRVQNISSIESKLSENKPNIIIFDLDYAIFNIVSLQSVFERNKLFIVAVSTKNLVRDDLLRLKIFDLLKKPGKNDNPAPFLEAVAAKILDHLKQVQSHNATYLTPQYKNEALSAVTEHSKVIGFASSTGGVEVLEKILMALPVKVPPIFIVQHMPSGFTKLLATRFNKSCKMEVLEAQDGMFVKNGVAYIAPADSHMDIIKDGGRLRIQCFKGAKIHGVMPAADVLFDSLALISKKNALGIILTGMGSDGARGLLKMRLSGALTIGQSEQSCVIYGMPKVAKDIGAVCIDAGIPQIATEILNFMSAT